MCGFAGVVARTGFIVDRDVLARMGEALAHRGPDDRGLWVQGRAGLVHRRLAILDVEGGKQPMHDVDGRVHVAFNGQIYNHLDVRAELEALGHAFVTHHSDTEVLVHGMRAFGPKLCARLSGMFAFAAFDASARTLLLARDAMGKKPLYVATRRFFDDDSGIELAFASELSALATLPRARRRISETALARFLAFDFVPDPDCIYEGVFKIPAGMQLHLHLDDLGRSHAALEESLTVHSELSFDGQLPSEPRARTDRLRAVIDDAVRTRLVADVPVGVFLSGGLDSSFIAALAARHQGLQTFSVAFRDRSYDESSYARRVAHHIGSTHHEELLDEDTLLDVLPRVADALAEPFADHSVVPMYLLACFARQHVKVALGGDGGDELFLGYPTFVAERLRPRLLDVVGAQARPLFDATRALLRRLPAQHGDLSFDFKAQQLLLGAAERRPLRRHQLFLTGMDDARVRRLFRPDARLPPNLLSPLDVLEERARQAHARDVFDVLSFGYAKTYLAAGVLQKVDRATMAVGLEARAPLLDRRVVAHALALTTHEKLHGLTPKHALKEAARGLVPDDIIDRKKKGFGMPVASWLIGPLAPFVDELLSPRALRDEEHLDPTAIARLLYEHRTRRANHRKTLWALFMYRWWKTRVHGARP